MDSKDRTIVSPSLLPPLSWKDDYKYDPDFDLGVGEWMREVDIKVIEKVETAKRRITLEKRL